MWLVMGFGAIVFAILNLVWTSKQKNSKCFGFIMDIVPSMSKALWICVIISILVNSITLLGDKK